MSIEGYNYTCNGQKDQEPMSQNPIVVYQYTTDTFTYPVIHTKVGTTTLQEYIP